VSILPVRNSDGSWAKSDNEKAAAFATHLRQVFTRTPLPIPTTLWSLTP